MVTRATGKLPIPKSDDEFDDIMADVLPFRYGARSLIRFGRKGQKQHGIDGIDQTLMALVWQSTLQRDRVLEKLTKDIDAMDIEFGELPIEVFVACLGFERDANLQRELQKISKTRQQLNKCRIEALFWEEISSILSGIPALYEKHFPQYAAKKESASPLKVEIDLDRPMAVVEDIASVLKTTVGHLVDAAKWLKGPFKDYQMQNLGGIARNATDLAKQQGVTRREPLTPRIVNTILEQGSFEEDAEIQRMWAQLIVNAQAGLSIGAYLFELLGKLDSSDAKLLQKATGYYGHYPSYTSGTGRLEALGLVKEEFEVEVDEPDKESGNINANLSSSGYCLTELGRMLRDSATKSIAQIQRDEEEERRKRQKL